MPIGLWAIMTAGGAYCAMDPNDMSSRFYQLISQMRVKNVLVHAATESFIHG
jgi:hypothetical protein